MTGAPLMARLSYEPDSIAVLHAKALADLIVTPPALAALKVLALASELLSPLPPPPRG